VKRIEAKLYVADGPADAHLLRGLLEAEGLTAFVRDDGMVPLQAVGFFKMETRPSVWVLSDDDAQHERAVAIADGYASGKGRPAAAVGEPWRCRACGETVEEQFTACWSCEVPRDS
jgi:hypothetical protein